MSCADSSSGTKNRASAKEEVLHSWSTRRKQSDEKKRLQQQQQDPTIEDATKSLSLQADNSTVRNSSLSPSTLLTSESHRIPVCRFLRDVWHFTTMEMSKYFATLSQNHRPPISNSRRQKPLRGTAEKSFPSLLEILQAHAVANEVESFQSNHTCLQMMPAGYDWNQAILQMTKSRSRAFLLLDLAAIVKSHTQWKHRLNVQLQYTVQHNRDVQLLKALLNMQVRLRCNSRLDIEACLTAGAADTTGSDSESRIVDHTEYCCKPNGYLRKLVLECHNHTLAIDGPDQAKRIASSLLSMAKRRSNRQINYLDFVLRLPADAAVWKQLLKETLHCLECDLGTANEIRTKLVGFSVGLLQTPEESNAMFAQLESLLDQQMDGVPMPLSVDFTGLQSADLPSWTVEQLSEFSRRPGVNVSMDASLLLLPKAGALCARIIGVKEEEGQRMHYYIDDGCYGSLCHYHQEKHMLPLPLTANSMNKTSQMALLSTVWGPTCDGLDRVCRDIPLPLLQRDDWLVFPDLGCSGGEGTNFNGFDPRDTAYCVLGYFRRWESHRSAPTSRT